MSFTYIVEFESSFKKRIKLGPNVIKLETLFSCIDRGRFSSGGFTIWVIFLAVGDNNKSIVFQYR